MRPLDTSSWYNFLYKAEQEVEITTDGNVLHASLPEIDIWGVLLISASEAW